MPGFLDIGKVAGNIVDSIGDTLDDLFTSEEERKKWNYRKEQIRTKIESQLLDIKKTMIEEKSNIIQAEVESESWLTKTWRPLTMLMMVVFVGAYWLGFTPETLPEYAVRKMFTLVQIGIGGYIGSRGLEKVTRVAGEKYEKAQKARNSNG